MGRGHKLQLEGQRFNYLTVLRETNRTTKRTGSHWLCRCDCGNIVVFTGADIKHGNNKHCGCKTHELFRAAHLTHGHTVDGKVSSEYQSWAAMISRCTYSHNKAYQHYGGRGIKVCERWLKSFENFVADMGLKPNPRLTIERIDNDGNYELSNCKWATMSEQMLNRSIAKKNRALP